MWKFSSLQCWTDNYNQPIQCRRNSLPKKKNTSLNLFQFIRFFFFFSSNSCVALFFVNWRVGAKPRPINQLFCSALQNVHLFVYISFRKVTYRNTIIHALNSTINISDVLIILFQFWFYYSVNYWIDTSTSQLHFLVASCYNFIFSWLPAWASLVIKYSCPNKPE